MKQGATHRPSPQASRRRDRVSKGDRREAALLDAAEDALRHMPLGELTMEAITSRAGISRSTAYFYFHNKEGIVHAVIDRATGQLFSAVQDVTSPEEEDGSTAPERGIRVLIANWRLNGHIYRVGIELAAHPQYRDVWPAQMAYGVDLWCQAIAYDRSRGLLTGGDPAQDHANATALCWMAERMCYLLFTRDHTDEEEQQLYTTLTTLCHRGLGYTSASDAPSTTGP